MNQFALSGPRSRGGPVGGSWTGVAALPPDAPVAVGRDAVGPGDATAGRNGVAGGGSTTAAPVPPATAAGVGRPGDTCTGGRGGTGRVDGAATGLTGPAAAGAFALALQPQLEEPAELQPPAPPPQPELLLPSQVAQRETSLGTATASWGRSARRAKASTAA